MVKLIVTVFSIISLATFSFFSTIGTAETAKSSVTIRGKKNHTTIKHIARTIKSRKQKESLFFQHSPYIEHQIKEHQWISQVLVSETWPCKLQIYFHEYSSIDLKKKKYTTNGKE